MWNRRSVAAPRLVALLLAGASYGCGEGTIIIDPVAPSVPVRSEAYAGTLGFNENLTFTIAVAAPGTLSATLTWPNSAARLGMDIYDASNRLVASATAAAPELALAVSANATAQTYRVHVQHCADECVPPASAPASGTAGCATAFSLTVTHP